MCIRDRPTCDVKILDGKNTADTLYFVDSITAYDAVSYTHLDPPRNGTFAYQKRVSHAGQPIEGIRFVISNRFAGTISARHHQNLGSASREQQVLQRDVYKRQIANSAMPICIQSRCPSASSNASKPNGTA